MSDKLYYYTVAQYPESTQALWTRYATLDAAKRAAEPLPGQAPDVSVRIYQSRRSDIPAWVPVGHAPTGTWIK